MKISKGIVLAAIVLGMILGGGAVYLIFQEKPEAPQQEVVEISESESEAIVIDEQVDTSERDEYYNETDVKLVSVTGTFLNENFGTYLAQNEPEGKFCELLVYNIRHNEDDFPKVENKKMQKGPLNTPRLISVATQYFGDEDFAEDVMYSVHSNFTFGDVEPHALCQLDDRTFVIGFHGDSLLPFEVVQATFDGGKSIDGLYNLIPYQPIYSPGLRGGVKLFDLDGETHLIEGIGDAGHVGWSVYVLDEETNSTTLIEACGFNSFAEVGEELTCRLEYQP